MLTKEISNLKQESLSWYNLMTGLIEKVKEAEVSDEMLKIVKKHYV